MAELKFNPGDYIQLKLAQFKEIEGTALESYDKSLVLLKLRSGYNIGIPKENILGSKVLRKFKDENKEYKLPSGKGKPKIGMVVCGGTIASKLDGRTGAVSPLTSKEDFAKFYPKLFERYDVEVDIPFRALSANMDSSNWIEIAKIVQKMLNDKDIRGVIVTHGTDTIHYTAGALSFFLKNLNKPVAFTYSQRSIDRASSDADLNLMCSAQFATSDCAEVALVGHASTNDDFCYALIGTKTKKMHTSRRDAFKPVNIGPLAKIWEDKVEFLEERRPRNDEKVELDDSFSDKITLVKFYPGQDPDILDYYKDKGYKGIVIEATGLGHVAANEAKKSWIPKLKKLISSGIVVCFAAQTIFGRLNPKVYSYGREIEETGVIFLEDMLAETAFVKLGWVLGHRTWKGKEKEKMLENFAREFNELLKE